MAIKGRGERQEARVGEYNAWRDGNVQSMAYKQDNQDSQDSQIE